MKESRFVKTKIAAGYLILIAVCILSVGYVYRTVVRYSAPDGSYALLQSKRRAVNEVLYHLYQAESYGQLMIAGYQSCEALYRRELRAVRGCIDSLRRFDGSIDSLQTKLAAVGSIEKQRSGISIRRENQSYSILVGFDFIGSYELSRRLIERTLKQFNEEALPIGFTADSPTYQFAFGKKNEQVWLILLVVAIIYTMCAILFESLLKPLVIILMIPISFIGVFLVFGWTDFVFDQGGFAAFVLLCGIVVNAGIYLINEAQNLRTATRKRGIALYLKAYNHKIVPIWLTILSTVLGLVPFLYDGPSEVFWFAFAMAAIAGTLFSMVALVVYLPLFLPLKESAAERETPTPESR